MAAAVRVYRVRRRHSDDVDDDSGVARILDWWGPVIAMGEMGGGEGGGGGQLRSI